MWAFSDPKARGAQPIDPSRQFTSHDGFLVGGNGLRPEAPEVLLDEAQHLIAQAPQPYQGLPFAQTGEAIGKHPRVPAVHHPQPQARRSPSRWYDRRISKRKAR